MFVSIKESPVHPVVTSITVARTREGNRPWRSIRLIVIESIHKK